VEGMSDSDEKLHQEGFGKGIEETIFHTRFDYIRGIKSVEVNSYKTTLCVKVHTKHWYYIRVLTPETST